MNGACQRIAQTSTLASARASRFAGIRPQTILLSIVHSPFSIKSAESHHEPSRISGQAHPLTRYGYRRSPSFSSCSLPRIGRASRLSCPSIDLQLARGKCGAMAHVNRSLQRSKVLFQVSEEESDGWSAHNELLASAAAEQFLRSKKTGGRF